ncbi:MAG TPA: hypothetical protein VFR24_14620 [Candidatus Angelobacter sp.]|nr:hypothetical protein [Candidatus Angelobacter sp.]
MKQLPDIVTSATFWAQIATMWAAAGAWFTYVATAVASRQQTYEGVLNLIEGLEAELALVSDWASGSDGEQGYVRKTRLELTREHPDWVNPSRAVFKFDTPTLINLTNSPYASHLTPIVRQFVVLRHAIRRVFDNLDRYQMFVFGDTAMYQSVLRKYAPAVTSPTTPTTANIVTPPPGTVGLTEQERVYVNHIFGMNETIHQTLIGGADSTDENCLYQAFRNARTTLQNFKRGLKRESLPRWFWLLHIIASVMAGLGVWQVVRWFGK